MSGDITNLGFGGAANAGKGLGFINNNTGKTFENKYGSHIQRVLPHAVWRCERVEGLGRSLS